MHDGLLVGTLYNTAILLAVSLLFDVAYDRDFVTGSRGRQTAFGAGLGMLTVATMAAGVEVQPGVLFDTRSVVLSLSGLFFGAWPALTAGAVALAYRLWLGGPAVVTGALVIATSVAMGLAWSRARRARPLPAVGAGELLVFGLGVAAVELALFVTLPGSMERTLLPVLAPVNLLTHPLATVVVGLLVVRKLRRVERERALRSQGYALRLQAAALEAAGSPVLITDREGTIEWVNPAFTETTGYSFDEAVGRNPRELVNAGVHPDEFFSELWRTILDGRVWRGQLTNRRKDGTLYEEEQTITPVRDDEGRIAHFVAVKLDVSERHAMEEQLRSAQKMETVGRLAGGVAHDFNNLLTVILGTADLVLDELDDDDPLRPEVGAIRETAQRAADLTRQLLAFSRKQLVQVRVLDLNETVRDLSSMLRRLLGEDVVLDVQVGEAALPVEADQGQLQQVIINLVVNARDAMPDGGRITVRTEASGTAPRGVLAPPVGDGRPNGRWVGLVVSDQGTGMPRHVQDKIFEPFFTTKAEGKGTGLGLATVYGIVGQAGGDIEIESEVGVGTTFRVFLPEASALAGSGPDPHASGTSRATGSATVLVVEDDPAIRRVAQRVLSRAGHRVRTAETPSEALEILADPGREVDLLFTDVVMPDMSGTELARRARDLRPSLHVLLASGYAVADLEAEGALEPGLLFLAKPYTVEGLTAAVDKALGQER